MPVEFAISALVTLLVVVDPVGLAPTFLAVTDGLSAQHRRQVALRASLIAAAILIGAALVGDWLLRTARHLAAGVPHRRRAAAVRHRLRDGVRLRDSCASSRR